MKLIIAIGIMLIGSGEAIACSCLWPPPVDEIFRESDAVVVAKLKLIHPTDETSRYDLRAAVTIEKVYKGQVKVGEKLPMWMGDGANCIFPFRREDIGKRFLLYLSKPVAQYPSSFAPDLPARVDPLRHATICNRSAQTEHAVGDLSFLDRFEELKSKTRITAFFVKSLNAGPNTSNLKIWVAGENKSVELSAKDGLFETYEFPPGSYVVSFPAEPGWIIEPWTLRPREEAAIGTPYIKAGRHEIPVEIGKAQHIELRILMIPSAAVKGRVLSPDGQPMKGVHVCLADRLLAPTDWCRTERTDASGDFSFKATPAGKYYLIVNFRNRISTEHPFNTVYYPANADPSDARMITVGANAVSDLVIQIPKVDDLITFRGKTVFADGVPVRARVIRFLPDIDGYEGLFGQSSENGEFEITVPSMAKGRIVAEFQLGKDRACPAHLKLFDGIADSWTTIKSNEVAYPSAKNADHLLTFPVASCQTEK